MAVRIPRVKQIQSTKSLPKNERINVNVQDQSRNILGRTSAIESVVKTGAGIYHNYENDKINQIGYEDNLKYNEWNTTQLQRLRKIEGDPTDAYVEYEELEKQKIQELVDARPNLSERVKERRSVNLQKIQDSNRLKVLKQRGLQVETYKNNLFTSTIKLKKNDLAINAANVKPDAKQKSNYDTTLDDITKTIIQRGLENKTVTRLPDDAKGGYGYVDGSGEVVKVKLDNNTKLKIAKEQGEGIAFSIKSAIDSGETEQARTVYDKYKDRITSKDINEIRKKFEKEGVKSEATGKVAEIRTLPVSEQSKAIDKIKDPEVRNKARDILVSINNKNAALKRQQETINGDEYYKVYDALKEAGQINGVADLENHTALKSLWPQLSRKMQKSIKEDFNAPKKSNPDQIIKLQDMINWDIDNTSEQKFRSEMIDITTGDRRKYARDFKVAKERADKTFKRNIKNASVMLKNKLAEAKLISLDDKGKIAKGWGDTKEKARLKDANDDLSTYLEGLPSNTTEKELTNYVDKYIAEKKKTDLFGGGGFFQDDVVWNPYLRAVPETDNPFELLANLEDRTTLQEQYKDRFGILPDFEDEAFKEFVRTEIEEGRVKMRKEQTTRTSPRSVKKTSRRLQDVINQLNRGR